MAVTKIAAGTSSVPNSVTPAEYEELSATLSGVDLRRLWEAGANDSPDQLVKVISKSEMVPPVAGGYVTAERYILNKRLGEMEQILGMPGALKWGAYVLGFAEPLPGDAIVKRGSVPVSGGTGLFQDQSSSSSAPRFEITRLLTVRSLVLVEPGQDYHRTILPLATAARLRTALLDEEDNSTDHLSKISSPVGGAWGLVRSGGNKPHTGWDLYANARTPARAVGWGRVAAIRDDVSGYLANSYGNYVTIELLGREAREVAQRMGVRKLFAFYGHLSTVHVEEDDDVYQGQVIGLTGKTGNAWNSPPHLHFELRRDVTLGGTAAEKLAKTIDPGELLGYGAYACMP